jgi:hypothetical protein
MLTQSPNSESGLDLLRRLDRVLSVVLPGKGRHHGVAEHVHYGALVRLDRVGYQGHELAHAREHDCRIEHVRHAGESARLRKQNHQRRALGLVRFASRHLVFSPVPPDAFPPCQPGPTA